MNKKRLIVSMNNLPEGVNEAIKDKYPGGYQNFVIKVPKGDNDFFYAITVDMENASYLVKVNVKIDSLANNDDDDEDNDDDEDIPLDSEDKSIAGGDPGEIADMDDMDD